MTHTPVKPPGKAGVWARRVAVAFSLLAVVEIGTRIWCGGHDLAPAVFRAYAEDRAAPYAALPGAISKVRLVGRNLVISIDGEGHRFTPGAGAAEARRLHLVGDSQVFGWGLSDDETIGAHVQNAIGPRFQVINHGIPGIGPPRYAKALEKVPPEEWAVVVYMEENDVRDTFDLEGQVSVRCGYLLAASWTTRWQPCFVLDLRLLQLPALAHQFWVDSNRLVPLQYSRYSRAATSALMRKAEQLLEEPRRRLGRHLITTYVPWVGRLAPAQRSFYLQTNTIGERTAVFPDDCGVEAALRTEPDGATLYIKGDTHLSARGALLAATAIAAEINRRAEEK